MTGSLCEPNIAADFCFERARLGPEPVAAALVGEELLDLGNHFLGQPGAAFEHAENDPGQGENRVQSSGHQFDRAEQLAEAVQGEIVRLHRQEDFTGGRQGVKREDAQRWRAVDNQVVEFFGIAADQLSQNDFASNFSRQFQFGRGEIDVRGDDPKVVVNSLASLFKGRLPGEAVIDRVLTGTEHDPEMQRGMSLWIEVEQADSLALFGECSCQVDCRRGLSDPTFLIDDRNPSHCPLAPCPTMWLLAAGRCCVAGRGV